MSLGCGVVEQHGTFWKANMNGIATYRGDRTFQRKLDRRKQMTASLEPDASPHSEEWGGGRQQLKKKIKTQEVRGEW